MRRVLTFAPLLSVFIAVGTASVAQERAVTRTELLQSLSASLRAFGDFRP